MAKLEYADLASPGAKFGEAARSMTRYKNRKAWRDYLRGLANQPIPVNGSLMEVRKARLDHDDAQHELDLLLAGEAPDLFHGVLKFPMPESE